VHKRINTSSQAIVNIDSRLINSQLICYGVRYDQHSLGHVPKSWSTLRDFRLQPWCKFLFSFFRYFTQRRTVIMYRRSRINCRSHLQQPSTQETCALVYMLGWGISKETRCIFSSHLHIVRLIDYGLDGPGIEYRRRRDFSHTSRPALRTTQPPVQWVPGLSRG
jgi:hypothetical protein